MLRVQVQGLQELEEALGQLPEAVGEKVLFRALYTAGGLLKKEAAARAPVGRLPHWIGRKAKGIRVEPGNLRRMLRLKRLKKSDRAAEIRLSVSQRAFYAYFLEFGTARMAAKPFLAPSFDSHKEEVLARIQEALGTAIDQARQRLSGSGA